MRFLECLKSAGKVLHGNSGDEEVTSRPYAKVYVLSDFVLCLVQVNQNPT